MAVLDGVEEIDVLFQVSSQALGTLEERMRRDDQNLLAFADLQFAKVCEGVDGIHFLLRGVVNKNFLAMDKFLDTRDEEHSAARGELVQPLVFDYFAVKRERDGVEIQAGSVSDQFAG